MASNFDFDLSKVSEVLLNDGVWHKIRDKSFEVKRPHFFGGESGEREVSLSQDEWFNFTESDQVSISGPLSVIFGFKRSETLA